MELEIWQGDWGLPSIDTHCLAVMTYCKFADAPVTFIKTNNPWRSPSGELPVLKCEKGKVAGTNKILNFLRQEKLTYDIVAYTAMLEEKLYPALLYWVDEQNYVELFRPWYAKALPLPFNFFFPGRYNREAKWRLQASLGGSRLTDQEREKQIYYKAKECLNYLSTKLGNKQYFLGDAPSCLDAIVFSYLAPILKVPFLNVILQSHLKCCNNLVAFCQRILATHFPVTPQDAEELRRKEEESREKRQQNTGAGDSSHGDADFPHKKRNIFIAGLVAVAAMVGYAFISGIIAIEIVDDNNGTDTPSTSQPPKFDNFDEFLHSKGQQEDEDESEE